MTTPLASLRDWLITGRPPRPGTPEEADAIARAAIEQGVAGLLDRQVARATPESSDGWPGDARQRLTRARLRTLVRGDRQLAVAARVHELLLEHGLRSLPLKGAALAERLYGPGERPMADVDILLLEGWSDGRRLLREAGLREVEAADHAVAWVDPGTDVIVEIHHAFSSCGRLWPLDADALWARRVPGRGHVRTTPSAEDLFVQMALHTAFQHGMAVTLLHWEDLRRVLATVDDARLWARARETRAVLPVTATLLALEAMLPGSVRSESSDALHGGGTGPLERQLEGDPLRWLEPSPMGLARWRWALAQGRRRSLLLATLDAREPGQARRIRGWPARAFRLIRRWGPAVLRPLGLRSPSRSGDTAVAAAPTAAR